MTTVEPGTQEASAPVSAMRAAGASPSHWGHRPCLHPRQRSYADYSRSRLREATLLLAGAEIPPTRRLQGEGSPTRPRLSPHTRFFLYRSPWMHKDDKQVEKEPRYPVYPSPGGAAGVPSLSDRRSNPTERGGAENKITLVPYKSVSQAPVLLEQYRSKGI